MFNPKPISLIQIMQFKEVIKYRKEKLAIARLTHYFYPRGGGDFHYHEHRHAGTHTEETTVSGCKIHIAEEFRSPGR